MDIDRAIEQLNALKLQPTANGNQVEHHHHQHPPCVQMRQRLQSEYEAKTREQELYVQRMQHEMQQMEQRLASLTQQNELLKKAVGSIDTYQAQVADQQTVIDGLREQVQQLRLTNYRLQYMVQQNERSGTSPFLPPPPPDIF
ncbi:hypothetical protein Poli38472_000835 [Pythium oligandrum]|uniref:Uncharacterized protein n=1 Tax=Pythium oligandrum TaxID=41045 RepID=A0A8K1FJJ3_PYTOL|nr:hypothetical protein Poli38472_000835 [Pythium oligandrum]|eukprot:TMW60793.1 hypothetical protein Poli38472_000835 [Pythium oligandrum]